LADVDDVEPGGRIDLEAHLDGPSGHGRKLTRPSARNEQPAVTVESMAI
jgi:hypothetical protein